MKVDYLRALVALYIILDALALVVLVTLLIVGVDVPIKVVLAPLWGPWLVALSLILVAAWVRGIVWTFRKVAVQ